jgi:diguanylate cyclase (GGDEF)-like protein
MYNRVSPEIVKVISDNTILFAEAVCQALNDTAGTSFVVKERDFKQISDPRPNGMIVMVYFAGAVQGFYIIYLQVKAAQRLMQSFDRNVRRAGDEALLANDEFSDFLTEILNAAVGQAIGSLEEQFGGLGFMPSVVVFGTTLLPKVTSGSVTLEGPEGSITCIFSLNMVNLKIAKKLAATLSDLEQKRKEAASDSLTGLFNHAYFKTILEKHINESRLFGEPLALIMVDIDRFRDFNSNYGHLAGDFVIRSVADIIRTEIRDNDIAARYGGDEFAVLLPRTTANDAVAVAARIKHNLAGKGGLRFNVDGHETELAVTLSIGVGSLEKEQSPESFLKAVDGLLYKAKDAGRDAIISEGA